MGIPLPLQDSDKMAKSKPSLRSRVLEAQAKRAKKQRMTKTQKVNPMRRIPRARSVLMKRKALLEGSRRARLEGSRRLVSPVEKKLRTLKKLIPNKESIGLDGLFRDTAEYILALQMRVKVMKIMMEVLTASDE